MPDRPLLIFPSPTTANRETLSARKPQINLPSAGRQSERIGPKFDALRRALEAEAIALRATAAGAEPEQVIVLDIVGSVEDFANAVGRVDGLEWLAEWSQDELPADDDFYRTRDGERDQEKPLSRRLFLVMTNRRGMDELVSLWERYQADPDQRIDGGLTRFRDVFKHLRDLRRWGEQDRILETGMEEYWRDALEFGRERIRFEVEFWYRSDPARRASAYATFREVVESAGGTCTSACDIPEIAYQAAVVQLEPTGVRSILDRTDARMLRSNDVMFFRPLGQCSVEPPDEADATLDIEPRPTTNGLGPPVAALLDGLPLENHPLLAGRLEVDDPDDWASSYPSAERQHGTAMASLIAWGDLDAGEEPLGRALYVRPIMRPNPYARKSPRDECIPEEMLPADLIHRAVRRMMEGDGEDEPTAPGVRIVNLSLGDPSQLFDHRVSAWARLLDWLSWKYRLLFIVSVGNHNRPIVLERVEGGIGSLGREEVERRAIRHAAPELRHRRLLSPAESINSITVGSTHDDCGPEPNVYGCIDPQSPSIPSLNNTLGLGFQRSIKPEILLPGGWQLYRERVQPGNEVELIPIRSPRPPGIRVAMPAPPSGERCPTGYTRGSSNSAALATRGAIMLLEHLLSLRSDPGGEVIGDDHIVVLLKALLVHGADWSGGSEVLEAALRGGANDSNLRNWIARFLGYGTIDLGRVLACTENRATMIGCGDIGAEQGHEYSVPLPPSLGGRIDWRRLTVTLAWLTPVNPQHQKYRRAHLWFDPPRDPLRVARSQAEWRSVRKGTTQHEVLEGEDACVISDGDTMKLVVNCRPDAGGLTGPVPYALAVSLEVADGVEIAMYDEVRTRLRPRIKPPGSV